MSESRLLEDNLGTPVVLHVYDLIHPDEVERLRKVNNYLILFGLGFFHSGVEIFGKEYSFGANNSMETGVFSVPPKQTVGAIYRQSILIAEYPGSSYSLFYNNCNHFSNDLCERLCGKSIPKWINRLAFLASYIPCIRTQNEEYDEDMDTPLITRQIIPPTAV
ncbi:DeSI-like protein At4g17486 [Galdieria sulphuraria]|nr:DeSI-like protein At4g17486 [Galdieria sulphuraria]